MSKFGKALDAEQYRSFKKAWILKGKIEDEVMELANMNISLAYGAVKTSESLIDMVFAKKVVIGTIPPNTPATTESPPRTQGL